MHNADGLVWKDGSQSRVIAVEESEQDETVTYRVRVAEGNRNIFEISLVVDWDMWGGGFVKAVQADQDNDLEVLMWGRREGGWLLDHQGGRIIKTPFDKAPEPVIALSEKWYDHHYSKLIPALVLPVVIVYYLGYGLIRLVMRARQKKKEGREGPLPL